MELTAVAEALRKRAEEEGFAATRFTSPDLPARDATGLRAYLADRAHGEMGWMADRVNQRADPRALWPEVRSVIALAANYAPPADPMSRLVDRGQANVSVYAWNRDYHDLMKARMKRIARWLSTAHGAQVKVFVDTAPVLERALAGQAGIGWQGKHTNLVSREFGSWLFLGEIFTDLDLPADQAETDHCGSCRRCLDICPTGAFPRPYTLDPRRCLSYWTIEHKGPIPQEFRAAMGNRVYGCDDCLAVCPWNKFAQSAREAAFQPRAALTAARLTDFIDLDDAGFRAVFSKSPVKRMGRDRFLHNVLIGLGNAGDPRCAPAVERRLRDASALVRGAAVWALSRLLRSDRFAALAIAEAPREMNPEARAEWAAVDFATPKS